MNISKRSFVRIISLSIGTILALLILAVRNGNEASAARRAVGNSYMRAVEEISINLDSIKNNLEKGMYTNSVSMLSTLSEKLCSDAASAKNALSGLPLNDLDLSETYRFLSQVGNYSKSLAKKCAEGQRLTDEENENLRLLYNYAERLSDNMWQVEERIEKGKITFSDAENAARGLEAEDAVSVTDGFTDIATSDNTYPTLIYDGPYSDHLLDRKPRMTDGVPEVTEDEAKARARELIGASTNIENAGEESGRMPSYVFTDGDRTVGVTKNGGMYTYMLAGRKIGTVKLNASQATAKAQEFLSGIGIRNVTDTYYEINGGVCVINFAAMQNGVVLYTDLIKAEVALDNGEVLGFDMRGYLTNHCIRDLGSPKITPERAAELVSKRLAVTGTKLCLIPTDGQNERLCYEVRCTGENGGNVLVYVNAETGREEQILLLKIGSGGVLTV